MNIPVREKLTRILWKRSARRRWMAVATLVTALLALVVSSLAEAGSLDLDWFSIGGGGPSQGGDFSLQSSMGQPDAAQLAGGKFAVSGGFQLGAASAPVIVPTGDCSDLLLSSYQTSPDPSQFVDLTNAGAVPIDMSGCSLATYDALTELSIGAATIALQATLGPGDTFRVGSAGVSGVDVVIPDGSIPNGPGGFGVLDAPPPPDGTPVVDVLPDVLTGMVYLDSTTVFGVSHLAVTEHNAIYECIYGGSGAGPFPGPFPVGEGCLP